jgi:hypothetical protein
MRHVRASERERDPSAICLHRDAQGRQDRARSEQVQAPACWSTGAVNARRLSDGTYSPLHGTTVRGQGRVSRVRFRGVVVRRDRRAGRLILSAGRSETAVVEVKD